MIIYRPERVGDKIRGRVVAIDYTESEYTDEPIPLIDLERFDGHHVRVEGFHSILRRELAGCAPRVGDTLEIVYVGKRVMRDNIRCFHTYRAEVIRA